MLYFLAFCNPSHPILYLSVRFDSLPQRLSKMFVLAGTIAVAASGCAFAQSAPPVLSSPDQQLVMRFATVQTKSDSGEGSKLVYSLSFHGKQILEDSGLALELDDQPALGSDVHLLDSSASEGVCMDRSKSGPISTGGRANGIRRVR